VKVEIVTQLESMIMMFEKESALILVDFPQNESQMFIENANMTYHKKYVGV
jgi:hypothetical protein